MKFLLLLIFLSIPLLAQEISLHGTVKDSLDSTPLAGANVMLQSIRNPEIKKFLTTDSKGGFSVASLFPGRYLLEISFIGFNKYSDTLRLRSNTKLPDILLIKSDIEMESVTVTGEAIPAVQKEDTIEFNSKSFKTNPDANAEELVQKIPGIQKEDGVIKAQGEEVKKVLVDGKQFFGDDPSIVLRNLPADVVDKIQVFDQMSEQSQFTGFDDGNTSKTINIVTRPERRNGQFGKLYGGYGTEERFAAGGVYNIFNNQQRISLLGLSNNVNMQNFTAQDLVGVSSGGGGRRGGGGGRGSFGGGGFPGGGFGGNAASNFLVGNQDGNTRTNSFGINYSDELSQSFKFTTSYFFNYTNNNTEQLTNRIYFSDSASYNFYDEADNSASQNYNHRFNGRFEYEIDSASSLLFTPRLSYQDNSRQSRLNAVSSTSENALLSAAGNIYNSDANAYNFSGDLLYRYKFALQGRTLSLSLNSSSNNREFTARQTDTYYGAGAPSPELTRTESPVDGYSAGTNIVYTEPMGDAGIIQLNLNSSFSGSSSNKKLYNVDMATGMDTSLNQFSSNEYTNTYITYKPGASYRYRDELFNIMAGITYHTSSLDGDQVYPYTELVEKNFSALLPMLRVQLQFSRSSNLRFQYNTSINQPSVSQLQRSIDISNPLSLKTGNPNLVEELGHRVMLRYMNTSVEDGSSFFAMMFFNYTDNYIGNTVITKNGSPYLPPGYILSPGTQFTLPINFDYSYSIRSFLNVGYPVAFLKSNMNFSFGAGYSKTPGLINTTENFAGTYSITSGITIASNFSEKLDFRIGYNPSWLTSKNTAQQNLDDEYIVHTASGNINWFLIDELFIKSDITLYYNTGLPENTKRDYYLWNIGMGFKFLPENRGELRLDMIDILKQNESLNRTITETYIENRSTQVLKHYFLLTFTYNIRNFGR